ncbi:methylmalonyl Co-A mutase-associated GTPase MeaB [Sediminibacillus albus]|uniref:LAO/AO transport system kinase n=1 Tax=Sediminibacillus albus TaxID=407036 RepID=A0A1G8ZL46_9BACI|nr:methylmalonyl Co-A mutase-associated GTPase MeaB [Sediminibacillus albus]SDK15753.1 LAO/AO transport system kinase [Sediminibacillus albus]
MHPLAEKIGKQDIRALAKAITMVENDHPDKLKLLKDIFAIKKNAHFVGITGAPGAGKSSLVNRLIHYVRNQGLTIAVIAVDPTSPFSGGALLGDRIRMNQHFTDPGVFIRSMATRGSLGGLARATKDTLRICDAYGFDLVLVETVGVGQSELDIMKVADTTALVLTPNSGDVLQVFKAGIMEIADLFIVNKADLPGVDKLKILLRDFLMISDKEGFTPPIISTVSTENQGIDQLWKQILAHKQFLEQTNQGKNQRTQKLELEIKELIREEIWREVDDYLKKDAKFQESINPIDADPYQFALDWYYQWKQGGERK